MYRRAVSTLSEREGRKESEREGGGGGKQTVRQRKRERERERERERVIMVADYVNRGKFQTNKNMISKTT